jgi:hypothetical protein
LCLDRSYDGIQYIGKHDLKACSIALHVIAKRWFGAGKYRDAFKSIKKCYLDIISSSEGQPRMPLRGLDTDLKVSLEEIQNLHPEGKEDFGRIVSDMLDGEPSHTTSPASFGSQEVQLRTDERGLPIGLKEFQSPQAVYMLQQRPSMPYQNMSPQNLGVNRSTNDWSIAG